MTERSDKLDSPLARLFGDEPLAGFADGAAARLVTGRNRALGNLLLAERAVFYTQILYRMLLLRRAHELEPLYETIFDTVHAAQESQMGSGAYTTEQFRADMTQLEDWNLVDCRIEIDRLRGYRDMRRRKFRYSLTEETVAFLEWLEERAQHDIEQLDDDTRDLLEEVAASFRELLGVLERFGTSDQHEDDARRLLYRLTKVDDLTLTANRHLGAFNARLLTFVAREYALAAAKDVLRELEDFVNHFLEQIHTLRGGIVLQAEALAGPRNLQKIRAAAAAVAADYRRAPYLFGRLRDLQAPQRVPDKLLEFYREDGHLDTLCRRIHDSAIKVWRKLHAHLREMERRSSRIEDLRERLRELATLPPEHVPLTFVRELIGTGAMRGDPNYWDDYEKADPPMPRRRYDLRPPPAPQVLRTKARGGQPVVSMEEARLHVLRSWVQETLGQPTTQEPRPLSSGAYTDTEDFYRIMELSKVGLLGRGRRLRRIQFEMIPAGDDIGTVTVERKHLVFRELLIRKEAGSDAQAEDRSGDTDA